MESFPATTESVSSTAIGRVLATVRPAAPLARASAAPLGSARYALRRAGKSVGSQCRF